MRRLSVALLFAVPPLFIASAQTTNRHMSNQPHANAVPHSADLPVTHVSLYKNGVGFFEHTGTVSGNAAVTLSFTSSQLDDVLQSLTAIDLNGGQISGADYNPPRHSINS